MYNSWLYGAGAPGVGITIDPAAITNAITSAVAVGIAAEGALDKMSRDHCFWFDKNMASVANEVALLRRKDRELRDAKKIRRQSFRREKALQPHLPLEWNIPNGGKRVRIDKWVGLAREKHPEVVRINNWVGMLEKSRNDTAKWLRDERVKAKQNYSFMAGFAGMEPLLTMASLQGDAVAAKALTYSCSDKVVDPVFLKHLFGSNSEAQKGIVPVPTREKILRMYTNFYAATGGEQGPFFEMTPPGWVWGLTPREQQKYLGLTPTIGDFRRIAKEVSTRGFSGSFGRVNDETALLTEEIKRRIKKGIAQPVSKEPKTTGGLFTKLKSPRKIPTGSAKPPKTSSGKPGPITKTPAITAAKPPVELKKVVPYVLFTAAMVTWLLWDQER